MQNIKFIFWLIFFFIISIFLFQIKDILSPFISSILIAYLLDPLTVKLEKLGVKRTYTVSFIVILFFTILIIFFVKVTPALFDQIKDFLVALPKYEEYINSTLLVKIENITSKIDKKFGAEIHNHLSGVASKIFTYFINILGDLFNSSIAVFSMIALIFFTPILVFYCLRDWSNLVKNIKTLIPIEHKILIQEQFKQIDQVLSACIRGQLTVCFILAFYYSLTLSLLGLSYSLLLGIFAGLLTMIPFIGFLISLSLALLIAILQFSDMFHIYLTLLIFLFGTSIESYVITPKLVGEKIGLHPVWIIFALMSGGCLFGFIGMFLALPCAAIIGVIVRSIIKVYLASKVYKN